MKYVPGPMFGQFSGSQGNTTASHNAGGSYVRNRTIPTNPATPSQTTARDLFTTLSKRWRILTSSQQSGWEQLAAIDPQQDTQGQTITLSGIAYYIKFNTQRNNVGLARIDDAPSVVEQPPNLSNTSLTADGTGGALNSTVTVTDGTANNFVLAYLGPTTSPAQTFFGRSYFRVVNFIAGDSIGLPTMAHITEYEAIFGSSWRTKVGDAITASLVGVSDSGFVGSPVQATGVII